MKIGILAPGNSLQAERLQHCLNTKQTDGIHLLRFPEQGTPRVGLDEQGVYWDDLNVTELDVIYTHGCKYMSPVVPPVIGEVDWSVWQTGHISEQQQYSFFVSALAELERHGVRVYNGLTAQIRGFMQAALLESLRAAGFKLPRIVYTNEDATAKALMNDWGQVLWRPGTGRATWQLFLDPQREHLLDLRKPPVLLAEMIEGPLLRAYVLDGTTLLCCGRSSPTYAPLETLEVLQAVDLPGVPAVLERLARVTGLRWCQVVFAWHDDEAWIYDVDPDPILDWLPGDYQACLLERLANGLLGLDPHAVPLPAQAQARSMIFLRRMLTPLFEIERMKYRPRP